MFRLDHLPNQRPDETVVLFLRRQWFAVLRIVVAATFLLGTPAAIAWYFSGRVESILNHPVFGPILTLIACMYVASIWLFSFLEFTDYYLDTWVITNERVINIEQKGLFNRVASELHLAAVQDVTSEVRGLIGTFFDYGDVFIQTAAEKERFDFKDIDHPEKVKELILKLVEVDKKRHAAGIVASIAQGGNIEG
ncbi:PH domain-containing protein [bacterium]|nr:PH domain-containing protein [bacterium]